MMYKSHLIRIGIDALGIDTSGGGRTSILNLIQKVILLEKGWHFILYLSAFEKELDLPNVTQVVLPLRKGILSRIIMQIILPFDVIRRKIDLVHFTKSQASLLLFTKTILTIHDVTILLHPEIHPKLSSLYWKYIQPYMARKMDAIIAVSNDGAEGITSLLKVPRKKISVIYNASQFSEDLMVEKQGSGLFTIEKFSLPSNYKIVIGQIALKKNLDTLIKAIRILKDRNDLKSPLVMVGPRYSISDAGDIFNLIKELDLDEDVIYLGSVDRAELLMILKNAEILLMPSIHEGFGIPCLEAMQLGVPVIASNASALPEVIGDAGMLVDNCKNPESWADAINELEESETLRYLLIKKGLTRARIFSWDRSAKILATLYRNVLAIDNLE